MLGNARRHVLGFGFSCGLVLSCGLGLVPVYAQQTAVAPPLVTITDPATGMQIGIPDKILVKRSTNTSGGARWQDKDEKITLDLLPFKPGEDLAAIFAKGTATNVAGRTITRKELKPDFFIIAGETAGGKFIRRMEKRADGAVGGFSLGYDKALAKSFDALAGQIVASYAARPAPPAAPAAPQPVQSAAVATPPSPRKDWFIATLIAEDTLITSSATINKCKAIKFDKINVSILKRDDTSGLALLKLPAKGTPLSLAAPVPERGFIAMRDEEGRLELGPARFADGKVEAAIQIYGGGTALLDEAGRLVGIAAVPPPIKLRITSAVPTMRHAMISAEQIARFAGLSAPGKTGEPASLGAVSAVARSAIFEMDCEL